MNQERLAGLLHGVLDDAGVIQIRVVLQQAPELENLLAGLLELRVDVLPAMHALDRGAAQSCDRTRRFNRELANLVLLIEAGLDLFDHVVEVLHRRADGPSRYLRVSPLPTGTGSNGRRTDREWVLVGRVNILTNRGVLSATSRRNIII